MKNKIDLFIRQIVKFNLPSDYPEELVDSHIELMKQQLRISKNKIKSILKINKQIKP